MGRYNLIIVLIGFAILEGLCVYSFGILHWLTLTLFLVFVSLLSYRISRNPMLVVGFVLLFFGVITGIEGYKIHNPGEFNWEIFIADFYTNVSAEAISIAITVIIIDSLNKRREARQELKERLISDLRDANLEVARRALIELRKKRWVEDGSLQRTYLCGANFSGADLTLADLSGAYLSGANFSGATMRNSKLNNADLSESNLQNADLKKSQLRWANLDGCDLTNTDMTETDLTGAIVNRKSVHQVRSYKNAKMPDGIKFELWRLENQDESSERNEAFIERASRQNITPA